MKQDETHEPAAVWLPIDKLSPWGQNPRQNDSAVDEVSASIKRFGFGAPIVARKEDGMVIAGHTRLRAAQRLGLDRVPVRFLDLDPADAKLLAIADNKVGEIAEWDDAKLAEVLSELRDDGALDELDGLGMDAAELDTLINGQQIEVLPEVEEDEAGEVSSGPVHSVKGEVYELGPHRLICGDCRDFATVERLMDGAQINVAFTSPPYASQRKYDESSGFKPILPDEYVDWFEDVQANVRAHLADDGSWFVNIKAHCEDGERHLYVMDLVIAHRRRWGWLFVDDLVWVRNSVPGAFATRFKNGWEWVYHFATGHPCKHRVCNVQHESNYSIKYDASHNFCGSRSLSSEGPPTAYGVSYSAVSEEKKRMAQGIGTAAPSNVLTCSNDGRGSGHSASFPVGLPSFFIRAYSDEGDRIFDPFLGSGTTLIAAAENKRIAYGCEISPAYCDLIRRRWTRWAKKNGVDAGPGALEDDDA